MKAFVGLLNSLMLAGYIVAIAIFSIQNIEPISLKFLVFQSINIPVGVLLAMCGGVGMMIGWFVSLLFTRKRRTN